MMGNEGSVAVLSVVRADGDGAAEAVRLRRCVAAPAGEDAAGAAPGGPAGGGERAPPVAELSSASLGSTMATALLSTAGGSGGGSGGGGGGGELAGLGLTFRSGASATGRTIKRVKEGGAAAREGSLVAGDEVQRIDGVAVAGLSDRFAPPPPRTSYIFSPALTHYLSVHYISLNIYILTSLSLSLCFFLSRDLAGLMMGRAGSVAVLTVARGGGTPTELRLLRSAAQPDADVGGGDRGLLRPELSGQSSFSVGTLSAEPSAESVGSQSSSRGAGGPAGLGLTFRSRASGASAVVVKRVKEGGAAAEEGSLVAGDEVEAIDGVRLAGLGDRQLAAALMGPEGSVAELVVRPAGGGPARTLRLRRSRGNG
jgi:hypothetical protein